MPCAVQSACCGSAACTQQADRYAVVNDKSAQAGFHLMSIRIDSVSGQLLEVRTDSFVTSGQPNRDEEGVCYVPQWNTVWISGEADGQIIEYQMDGQLTGRRLNIPDEFRTACPNAGFEALTYQQATHRFWTTSRIVSGPPPSRRWPVTASSLLL